MAWEDRSGFQIEQLIRVQITSIRQHLGRWLRRLRHVPQLITTTISGSRTCHVRGERSAQGTQHLASRKAMEDAKNGVAAAPAHLRVELVLDPGRN